MLHNQNQNMLMHNTEKKKKRKRTEEDSTGITLSLDRDLVRGELLHWIQERQLIHDKKEIAHEPKPWTSDPVLQNYRFCNVRRDNDRVTKWLFEHWYKPNCNSEHLAFAACMARHFNWPDTLEALGFPHKWEPEKVRAILKHRRDILKVKVYTGAYIGKSTP